MRWFRTENGLVARQLGRDDLQVAPYVEQTVSLAGKGNFTGGTVYCVRIGNLVTITVANPDWSASQVSLTASDVIPEGYRPISQIKPHQTQGGGSFSVTLFDSNGSFTLARVNEDMATLAGSYTSAITSFVASYYTLEDFPS